MHPSELTTGLEFAVANSLEQVLGAWRLVYQTYLQTGLIDPNPHGLHTNPQAVGPNTAVIIGRIRNQTVSTVTCTRDSAAGLFLDREYHAELDDLRRRGRRITEVGLLADRRLELSRSTASLYMLMNYARSYASLDGGTDLIIGVHPKHARFYVRSFGGIVAGPQRTCAAVNDHPVVLLRFKYETELRLKTLPRGLRYAMDHPLAPGEFSPRFGFSPAQVAISSLSSFVIQAPPPQGSVLDHAPRKVG